MKRILSMLLIAAMALTAFSACETDNNSDGNDSQNNTTPTSLAGTTWSDSFGIMTLTFTSETSVTQNTVGVEVAFTYTYADGQGTIGDAGMVLYTFKVNGNTMSLYNDQGEQVYTLNKVDGSTPTPQGDDLTNSTWVYDEDIDPYGWEEMMLMFMPSKMCGFSYELTDGQGEDIINTECVGTYSYSGNSGSFDVTNPDNPTESYHGTMTVSGETMTVVVMNKTFTLTKFNMPGR